jgi:hypothetical protein
LNPRPQPALSLCYLSSKGAEIWKERELLKSHSR